MTMPVFTFIATVVTLFVIAAYVFGISYWHDRQDKKRAQKHAH
jgi:hypothetical protein